MTNRSWGVACACATVAIALACASEEVDVDHAVDAGPEVELPDAGGPDQPAPDAGTTQEPAGRLVHWQVNIEWVKDDMGESMFPKRAVQKKHLPDIIAAQELWPVPACGWNNVDGQAALTSLQSCTKPTYGKNSFMGILTRITGREYDIRLMAKSANVVIWDRSRFSLVSEAMWRFGGTQALRDACCGGSSTEAGCAQSRNIGMAVLLDDHRGTADTSDDQLVAVSSIHTGGWSGQCVRAHIQQANRVFTDWSEADGGRPVSRRFISGDLNKRPDTGSSTAADRKREKNPDCWWRSIAAGHSCGGKSMDYFDTVWESKWDGSGGNDAPICGQWTFPINSDHTSCSVINDSAGQLYQRIDYVFLKGIDLTRSLFSSHVDQGYFDKNGNGRFDWGEAYSNSHRGVYTEVVYQ